MKELREYQNLSRLFMKSVASANPNKPALEILRSDREEILTFKELSQKTAEFAKYLLQNKGVKNKTKIAILGKNRIDWSIAFWGTVLAGAIPVLIDPERRNEGVKKHLFHTDAKILIMADDYQDREALKNFTIEQGIDLIEMTIYPKSSVNASLKTSNHLPDDTAVICCTSGTTDDPREVELTHLNLISNLQGALAIVKISSKDKLGHIIPFHHSFGLTVAKLLPLVVGATSIYTNKYSQVFQIIKNKKITLFLGVPRFFETAAKEIEKRVKRNRLLKFLDSHLPGLIGRFIVGKKFRFFVSGSAALPKWVSEVFWKRGIELRQGYGTTENSPVYGFNTEPKKLESVGKPIPNLQVKIAADGEILLAGPCVMKGYYKNIEANKKAIEVDEKGIRWLHTGDLGYLDEDNDLFITGRKKYLIVLPGGKKVSPELVEATLSGADYVKEILIVPGRSELGRETIKVIVYPDFERIEVKTGLPELRNRVWRSIQKCQQNSARLSSFEKITSERNIEIRFSEFEKTSTGKIKREAYLPK